MFSLLTLLTVLAAAGGDFEPICDLLAREFDHPQLAGGLLGLLVPASESEHKQPGLKPSAQRALAYALAAIVGALTVISTGQYNGADLVSTLNVTILASQAAYGELWKPTGAAAAIEKRTNLTRPELEAFSVIGDPGMQPVDVIDLCYEGDKFAGLRPAGAAKVHKSFEDDEDGGVLIAEGPVTPA
jgi:hypothetical protein